LRGQGGRISALCFLLSKRLQKYPGITFMGFATDGKDGSSPDPGYMINSQTYEKLAEIGDFDDMYDSQNTGRYLSDIGAGIRLKRQTNINLLDLIIIF
jgi:glycerate-2-kinase